MPSDAMAGREDPAVTDQGPSAVPPLHEPSAVAVGKGGLKSKQEINLWSSNGPRQAGRGRAGRGGAWVGWGGARGWLTPSDPIFRSLQPVWVRPQGDLDNRCQSRTSSKAIFRISLEVNDQGFESRHENTWTLMLKVFWSCISCIRTGQILSCIIT